jgi:USP6 N-terminal-like protein
MMVPLLRDNGGNVEYWTVKPSKEAKLRARTYKGIPDRWRAAAWELLIGRYSRTSKQDMDILAKDYREGIDRPSTYDVQIDLDVPRTISGHVMFRTRYGSG